MQEAVASTCSAPALPQARGFEIHTLLTENASLGSSTGYNIQEPSRLVHWEAQYGDSLNGAQVYD